MKIQGNQIEERPRNLCEKRPATFLSCLDAPLKIGPGTTPLDVLEACAPYALMISALLPVDYPGWRRAAAANLPPDPQLFPDADAVKMVVLYPVADVARENRRLVLAQRWDIGFVRARGAPIENVTAIPFGYWARRPLRLAPKTFLYKYHNSAGRRTPIPVDKPIAFDVPPTVWSALIMGFFHALTELGDPYETAVAQEQEARITNALRNITSRLHRRA